MRKLLQKILVFLKDNWKIILILIAFLIINGKLNHISSIAESADDNAADAANSAADAASYAEDASENAAEAADNAAQASSNAEDAASNAIIWGR